ncbi:unnamed protein product [Polarella glacialis]|uniref:Uncharacterized protein n=1 Tax=Polarella glacialis TaxID=89957 RepID=A0A813IK31_POLGL|nr:unnamed protein product [Polarella glacialis]
MFMCCGPSGDPNAEEVALLDEAPVGAVVVDLPKEVTIAWRVTGMEEGMEDVVQEAAIDARLQSEIRRQGDNRVLGTLKHNSIIWNESFKSEATQLKQLDPTTLEMTFAGEVYLGKVEHGDDSSKTIIKWNDGET